MARMSLLNLGWDIVLKDKRIYDLIIYNLPFFIYYLFIFYLLFTK